LPRDEADCIIGKSVLLPVWAPAPARFSSTLVERRNPLRVSGAMVIAHFCCGPKFLRHSNRFLLFVLDATGDERRDSLTERGPMERGDAPAAHLFALRCPAVCHCAIRLARSQFVETISIMKILVFPTRVIASSSKEKKGICFQDSF
jgi:hypothetical protein